VASGDFAVLAGCVGVRAWLVWSGLFGLLSDDWAGVPAELRSSGALLATHDLLAAGGLRFRLVAVPAAASGRWHVALERMPVLNT
jgi:hypothetical protein